MLGHAQGGRTSHVDPSVACDMSDGKNEDAVAVLDLLDFDNQMSPLHMACVFGRESIAAMLLEAGADASLQFRVQETQVLSTLQLACACSDPEAAARIGEMLVRAPKPLRADQSNFRAMTTLHVASSHVALVPVVRALLECDPDGCAKVVNQVGYCAQLANPPNILNPHVSHRRHPRTLGFVTPVGMAAHAGARETVELLVTAGAHPNVTAGDWDALVQACAATAVSRWRACVVGLTGEGRGAASHDSVLADCAVLRFSPRKCKCRFHRRSIAGAVVTPSRRSTNLWKSPRRVWRPPRFVDAEVANPHEVMSSPATRLAWCPPQIPALVACGTLPSREQLGLVFRAAEALDQGIERLCNLQVCAHVEQRHNVPSCTSPGPRRHAGPCRGCAAPCVRVPGQGEARRAVATHVRHTVG